MIRLRPLVLGLLVSAGLSLTAADWPQWLGPSRDGTTTETVSWTEGEPRRLWKIAAGRGFAGPAIAGSRAYLFHRREKLEVLTAVETGAGKVLWETTHPTAYEDDFGFDDGPRATPAVAAGRIFTLGANGLLVARDVNDGRTLWQFDARSQVSAEKSFFGFACSPLLVGDAVLLNLGGTAGAGVAALEAATGKIRWQRTDHEAGYASPVPAELGGQKTVLFFTREGLVATDVAEGRERFSFPWRARMSASVNAASPLVKGTEVFLTASYGAGAVLLDCSGERPKQIWADDETLSAHYATPVRVGEFLYGFHGRQEQGPSLRCVEWKTGKVRWSEERFGAGTLMAAGDRLLILRETGELMLVAAESQSFRPVARAQLVGQARAAFAYSAGILLARDKTHWSAFDLGAKR